MKTIHIISGVILIAALCQCGSALNLLGGLTNALNGTLNTVTKAVSAVTSPVLDTASNVIGTVAQTGEQVLGAATGALGGLGALNPLGAVVGGLVQTVGNVAEGIFTTAGVLVDGVVGLTKELLQSIQIFKKSDIPIYYKPLEASNYACVLNFFLEFQTLHPEFVRTGCNAYHLAEYFYNLHGYCITRSPQTEIESCMNVVRETAPAELNRFSVDVAGINANLAGEWSVLVKTQIVKCYIMNS